MYRLSLLIVLLTLPLSAQDTAAEQRLLRWMDHIAQKQLDEREAAIVEIRTQEQAEARKKYVRDKILELIGGLPDYDGPLNAKVLGRLDNDKFSIEKVIYESLPRFHVTANLYLPKTEGRRPLCVTPATESRLTNRAWTIADLLYRDQFSVTCLTVVNRIA